MTTGERLKELRQKANLTLQDAGELIGTSKQNLFKYENDIITNIPIDRLVKLAEIYNINLPKETLKREAIKWAALSSGRSNRVAKQFIMSVNSLV